MPTTLEGLLPFLIMVIILCVVIYVISVLMNMISLPPPVKTIAWLIVGLVVLIILLRALGIAV